VSDTSDIADDDVDEDDDDDDDEGLSREESFEDESPFVPRC
jgi:hypothetical protein